MFYYAEIDGEYLVINTHCLTEASANPNYISITEEQYSNGELVGMYFNALYGRFEIMSDDWVAGSNLISYNETSMQLSTKIDNMQVEINSKVGADHTHEGYVSSDDLALLEDIIDNKADATHTHTEYANVSHTHDGYATTVALDTLNEEISEKADASHTHTEYASVSHSHENYANVNHSHSNYSLTSHTHSDYATTEDVVSLQNTIDTKANSSHTHSNYVTVTDFNALEDEVDEKASATHTHSNYSETGHNHDDAYASVSHTHTATEIGAAVSGHNHDSDYADINHDHDSSYASIGHNHNSTYAPLSHSHSNYATTTSLDELAETVSGKANTSHTHDDRYFTETEINSKLAAKSDTTHTHTGIYDVNGAATSALESANAYTDSKIDAIVIPDALSDLTADSTHRTVTDAEKAAWNAKSDSTHNHNSSYDAKGSAANALSSANAYTDTAIDTLSEVVADKANTTDLTSHTGNATVHITSTERTNWNAAKTHANSAHAPVNAEENQNAFSNVVVNGTTIAADSKTDTLTFVAGNNVTITPDATGDSITISSANTVYIHPTTAGNKHIPAGGSSGQILRWSADGTAVWGNDNNTTYSVATQTADGLMSDTDKTKLDGIAEGANNYVLPSAGTSLGGVKSGGDVTIASGVITVNDDSHNHVISNVDGLQSALDGKAASGHNHDSVYYTETEVDTLLSGKANTSHTHTIANITNLQTTLDGKANTSHGTHVSYSTTAPVMDGSASVGTASTVARSDHKHPTDTSRASKTEFDTLATTVSTKANASDLTSHTSNKSNPHGVTLEQLQVTATASELNILDGVTATTAEINYVDGVTSNIQTQLNNKASSTHTHSAATTSAAGLMSASDKAKLDGIESGANAYTLPTASSTLGGVKTTSTVTSNSGYTACPIIGGVPYYKDTNTTYNLGSFGITATAAELNALDGITATVTELNYMDGVTSNVQTQLNGKAASSHGTHVTYDTTAPKANGTASAGTASTVSRSDHVHPLQTTVSGNAGTATKLATARTISLTGDVSGSVSFDGSANASITATVADDSHNHIIGNIDGLQTALDGKSATSHDHNSAYISKNLQFIGDNGGAIISINRDDGKNLLTELAALSAGFYTVYSQSGTAGNPKTTEAWRFMVHKTGATAGWVQGYGSIGSVYTNYIDGTNGWRGWRCIWDNDPNPLWSGQYYMSSPNSTPQTVTPSKKLSECRTGWLLLWSDYDAGSGSNDADFVTTMIPKNDPSGNKWGGKSFLCDIPRYVGSNAEDVDTERRIIKPIYVHDDCIKGSYQNDKDERNDVVLRAVYEF